MKELKMRWEILVFIYGVSESLSIRNLTTLATPTRHSNQYDLVVFFIGSLTSHTFIPKEYEPCFSAANFVA